MKLFYTECRRSLRVTVALVVCALLTGFSVCSAISVKNYIAQIFRPVNWGADLMILPKGVTPEGVKRSLREGSPEAVLPLALLETLQSQVQNEMARRHLTGPALRVLGFIPFRAANGQTQIAYVGNRQDYFRENQPSIWSEYAWVQWDDLKADLAKRPEYSTPEWGSKVLMGVLAHGEPGPIASLKNLIDRRTVAQGVLVRPGDSDLEQRLQRLDRALAGVVALIALGLLPGLALALMVLHERRQAIDLVLAELGRRSMLAVWQFTGLLLLPAALGVILAYNSASLLFELLRFS